MCCTPENLCLGRVGKIAMDFSLVLEIHQLNFVIGRRILQFFEIFMAVLISPRKELFGPSPLSLLLPLKCEVRKEDEWRGEGVKIPLCIIQRASPLLSPATELNSLAGGWRWNGLRSRKLTCKKEKENVSFTDAYSEGKKIVYTYANQYSSLARKRRGGSI